MLVNISWGDYCVTIGTLVLVWYLFLGFRFYYTELKQVVSGNQKLKFPVFRSNKSKQTRFDSDKGHGSTYSLSSSVSESGCTTDDVEELSAILVNAINESAARDLSSEAFHNYLRLILTAYPIVKSSAFRININELMVSESQQYPQLALTFAEIDLLWEETII